jgi:hypothetical protein
LSPFYVVGCNQELPIAQSFETALLTSAKMAFIEQDASLEIAAILEYAILIQFAIAALTFGRNRIGFESYVKGHWHLPMK